MIATQDFFKKRLCSVFSELGIAHLLNGERCEAFYTLYRLLIEENEKYNLTAITEAEGVILLHFADSLMGAAHIPEGASLIDVGCGAGFPSLPLALCRPDLSVTASDATAKKTAFVQMVAREIALANLTTLTARAEAAGQGEYRERFDVATARAVANLPVLMELATPFVRKGGLFLALKGKNAMEECKAAQHAAKELKCEVLFTKEYTIGEKEGAQSRGILLFQKKAATPKVYPRPFAKIKSHPL